MKRLHYSIRDANIVLFYMAIATCMISLITADIYYYFPDINSIPVYCVLEGLLLIIPVGAIALNSKVNLKVALKIKAFKLKDIFVIIGLAVCGYIIAVNIEQIVTSVILVLGGTAPDYPFYDDLKTAPVGLALYTLVLAAPFFEEFTVRGLLLSGYGEKGPHAAIWITAVLFGLMHGDIASFFMATFLGVVLGTIATGTGCIWLCVMFHALHNLFAYTGVLDQYALRLPWTMGVAPSLNTGQGAAAYMVYDLILLAVAICIFAVLFRLIVKKLPPREKKREAYSCEQPICRNKGTLYGLFIASVVVYGIFTLVSLAEYFIA